MQIHVAKNGQRLGPFPPEEVRQKLYSGELQGSDLGWTEGSPDWVPLASHPALDPTPRTAPGPPSLPAAEAAPVASFNRPAPTSGLGIASMICGIASWTALPFLAALPAIICGHLSLREIRDSGGRIGGRGMATAGLITGYLNVAMVILGAILLFTVFAALIGMAPHSSSDRTPQVVEDARDTDRLRELAPSATPGPVEQE
jgi:hypothetical protein